MLHVAVVHRRYLELLIDSSKTVEVRLSRNRCAPYSTAQPGEQVLLKQQSGPYRALTTITKITRYDNLKPKDITALRRQYNDEVKAEKQFWTARSDARYAIFLMFSPLQLLSASCTLPPIPTMYGRGWLTLPDARPIRAQRRAS
jgi:hypothetical protein